MSFFGFMSAPVSIPPVFDTSPCLEHLMEYEDCAIDVNTNNKRVLMPTWPTLYPSLLTGKHPMLVDARSVDITWDDGMQKHATADEKHYHLSDRQKQLLYECEEERLVFKACARELLRKRRTSKMTSWETAEIANMGLD